MLINRLLEALFTKSVSFHISYFGPLAVNVCTFINHLVAKPTDLRGPTSWVMVAHTFNPSTWETEAGGSPKSKASPGYTEKPGLKRKRAWFLKKEIHTHSLLLIVMETWREDPMIKSGDCPPRGYGLGSQFRTESSVAICSSSSQIR